MKFKLTYNPIYEFTTADYNDATDPPLIFEAHVKPRIEWGDLVGEWILDTDAKDSEKALALVGHAIISVSQNGDKYLLNGIDGAYALRDAIESENPGLGDTFILNLALGHYNVHYRRLSKIRKNLGKLLPDSDDGNSQND